MAVAGVAAAALPVAVTIMPSWEESAFRWINDLPDVPDTVAWLPMQVGNVLASAAAALVALAWRRPALAARLLGGGVATWLIAKAVKVLVPRGRPAAVLDDVSLRAGAMVEGRGWVSGHAAVAAALVTILWPELSRPWRVAAVVLIAPMYFARVYVGEHFPLDMLGGAFLGVACGRLVLAVFRRER